MTYWKKHILLFVALVLILSKVSAQSCTIIAKSRACIGETIGFSAQSSGSISSYSWNFNSEGTSVSPAPSFIFNSAGIKTITLILGFSGGASCTTTLQLRVNELPKTDFYIDSTESIYCRSDSKICLKDKTQPASSGAPLKQRVIVWGDGALSQNPDPENDKEDCKNYNDTGFYEITMEITDTNMCKSSYRRMVHIEPDLHASFKHTVIKSCDSVTVCFDNTSFYDSLNRPFFRWHSGSGIVDSATFDNFCRVYKSNGNFRPSLVLYNRFGCYDSAEIDDPVNVILTEIKLASLSLAICVGEELEVSATDVPGATFKWFAEDSTGNLKQEANTGKENKVKMKLPASGKWTIKAIAKSDDCVIESYNLNIIVKGPEFRAFLKNAVQCDALDTVHFCVESNYYMSDPGNCKSFWDFGDQNAANCIIDTRNNLNVAANCNYTVDSGSVKHFYSQPGCYTTHFRIRDTVSGCYTTMERIVSIGIPSADSLRYKSEQACHSFRKPFDYRIEFDKSLLKPGCGYSEILINLDSAAGKDNWQPFSVADPYYIYDSVANDSGWVTIGLILKMGEPDVYKGCNVVDTTKTGKVCSDTVWYHNYYRLLPEPRPLFYFDKSHGCQPFTVNVSVFDSTQTNIHAVYYQWGDSLNDTVYLNPANRRIPSFRHTYQKQGKYLVRLVLENTNYCQDTSERFLTVGFSKHLNYDSVVCTDQVLKFQDSIEYWDYPTGYWANPQRAAKGKEKVWWHFGDGSSTSGSGPLKSYNDTGTYQVAMVSMDSSACYDSSIYKIHVVGVRAGIKKLPFDLVCNEIVNFMDSSFKKGAYPGDSIVSYWWDFGDKKIPSVLKDPAHAFTSNGSFTITHVVQNIRGCTDSAKIHIKMLGPVPSFRFIGDSIGCAPLKVYLDNSSDSASVSNYIWAFGDPANTTLSTTSDSNVLFTYAQAGTYYLKLSGSQNVYSPTTGNTYYCNAVYPDTPTYREKKVIVFPTPLADFIMPDSVCPKQSFFLEDTSDPLYSTYIWRLPSDSIISKSGFEKYTFSQAGIYDVMYVPTYVPGPFDRYCVDTVIRSIKVMDISADFEIDPLKTKHPEIYFKNKSSGATQYYWNFDHPSSSTNLSTLKEPSHYFKPETGTFMVCLRVVNAMGCEDTICKPVFIKEDPGLKFYNVFSPGNDDGLNDAFDVEIKGEIYYNLRIYDRWGSLVFQSEEDAENNDGKNWNGRLFNKGPDCAAGTYFYIFEYQLPDEEKKKLSGTCTLIRVK